MIPSEEHAIEMFPMDFEEFLWALGDEMLMPFIRTKFEKHQPMGEFHRRAMDYFREYLIVGGMPQVVKKYVETKDFSKVEPIKRDILSLYRNDIQKYADNQETKVVAIFDEIPGQLQKHEKKFRLSVFGESARMRDYSNAFDKLEYSGSLLFDQYPDREALLRMTDELLTEGTGDRDLLLMLMLHELMHRRERYRRTKP